MKIESTGIYHIFNKGNYQQQLFFTNENYKYFLRKCHLYIKPVAEILAWNLLPTEFEMLLEITDKSLVPIKVGCTDMPIFSNSIRLLESTYAKGINNQMRRSGNLFRQKTRSRLEKQEDARKIFNQIHQAAKVAGLVSDPADWPFSSYPDYLGLRSGDLCNMKRASELFNLVDLNCHLAVNNIDPTIATGIF